MMPQRSAAYWLKLEASANRFDVQAEIRESIRQGLIRVKPALGGGIRIMACRDVATNEPALRSAG